MRRIVALGALALLLVACGRAGPIAPPGPPDQVTWPRAYPSR